MGSQKIKPLVYWLTVILGIACLIFSVETYNRDILTAPRSPNPATGNVVPYNNHGTIVYLTTRQALVERWGPFWWIASWASRSGDADHR
ncbi:hypothetical protein HDG38_000507 [Paraburkholderia sp. WSM4177]|nr:hypothetical protein [Paraburkholderia sp. WSM4177]MBB5482314.1 hypothetical protein [Paraburkholderia sp. WSM4180]